MVTELTEGFPASKKPRFQHVGAPVFGTENITVAAFIAEIGEVGNLVFLFQDQFSAFFNRPISVLESEGLHRNLLRRNGKQEITIIRTNRNAFITGQAIEQFKHGTDLGGRFAVFD